MRFNMTAFAAPCLALLLSASGAFAEETKMSAEGGMMKGEDAMATQAMDCVAKAKAETDEMKMQPMMDECMTMYPAMATMDPMAVDCFAAAHVETDMTKMDTMNTECMTMYPDAMGAMDEMAPSAM